MRGRAVWVLAGVLLLAIGYAARASHPLGPVGGPWRSVLGLVSATASLPAVAVGVLAVLAASRGRPRGRLLGALLSLVLGSLLVWALKTLVGEPRPPGAVESLVSRIIGADAYAWPSGHAYAAGVALYYSRGTRIWPLAMLWGLAVVASRVLLAAHYPGDVASGLGLALVVSPLVEVAVERGPPRPGV